MTFTKNIVIEMLRPYRGAQYLDSASAQSYRWIAMLPADPAEMEPDILYTCMLSEAIRCNLETPGFNYLSIRDRYTDEDEDIEALRGIIVINENKEVSWLFNLIQQRFLQINSWVMEMRNALIENCDYQQLVDISEPFLNNFVAILDSSYKLLAHTKNIACHDPIDIALLEKGYHSDEVLKKFQEARRFEVYEQEQGIIISPPGGPISKYEILNKLSRYGGEWLLHTIMECSTTPLSLAAVDLFEIFMENVNVCFSRQQRIHPTQIYSSLLTEILYGDIEDAFIISERAKTADVPFYGHFNAYRIAFRDNSTVLIGRFMQELMTYLPKSKIIAYNYEVSVLNVYTSSDVQKQSSANMVKLAPLFKKYGVLCGVSEVFETLPELKNACIQATRAQALGVQLRALGNFWQFEGDVLEVSAPKGNGDIFYYNDIYMYLMIHLAQSGTFDAFRNTLYNNTLKKLIDYDKKNNTKLVQVLYAHLVSERRATASGRLLHMHRNNVLYHISRIEEITGVDLDDYWTRLKLMLAFHFFELQESNRIFSLPPGNAPNMSSSAMS